MTISYRWLQEYIEITESPDDIGQVLTSTGLEVETIEPFESIKGGLKGFVIGEVLTCAKHPNADKLSLTTVDVGQDTPLNIVCGAPNVAAGQKVIVATPGTTLYPKEGEPFVIKKTKIRGEHSEGMICAEDEIGIGESHDGILVLNTSLKNGTPAAEYFNILSDFTIEIGLTPNRADAASHIGVARDIKAAMDREIKWPAINAFKIDNHDLPITVEVVNTEACPRYTGVTLSGVKVKESPEWLRNRLISIGLTPINNIVDVTNFVLHELGQPLHAFDADKIKGKKVIVKTMPQGSKFVTLDGKERSLFENDLMICDERDGMCIAGVFGGIHSGVTTETVNIFLESAYFSADYIRRTAMQHQLKTDASFRFERGTDPEMTRYALQRAILLMQEVAGGKVSSDIVDVYGEKIINKKVLIKDEHVNRLIGTKVPRETAKNILRKLDIEILEETDNTYTVSVPSYRVDVTQEADVIEEILRIYGFNNVELANHVSADFLAEFPQKDPNKIKNALDELLINNGFYEILTNSLTNIAYQKKHNLSFNGEPIEILNKLSEEQGIMRQTMLFSGLEVCAYNINRRQRDLKLYEFGKIYYQEGTQRHEAERLALYITGNNETENWQHAITSVTYHDLLQHVYHLLMKCGINNIKQEILHDPIYDYSVSLSDRNKEFGKLGLVKKAILKEFGIKQDLFYAELNTALLLTAANPKLAIQDVPKFPEVRRDLSLVIDKGITFEEIQNLVRATEKKLIKDVIVFDVYEGDKVPQDKKAYAMGFTLLDEYKTLTDQEIDKTMNRLINAFEQKLGAIIRK